jgi:hypothetical protein
MPKRKGFLNFTRKGMNRRLSSPTVRSVDVAEAANRSCERVRAEIFARFIHPAAFQIGMGGAPLALVHERADTAPFQKIMIRRRPCKYTGDEIEPGLGQGSPAQIIEAVALPERGAEAEDAVIADGEAVISCAALEKAISQLL